MRKPRPTDPNVVTSTPTGIHHRAKRVARGRHDLFSATSFHNRQKQLSAGSIRGPKVKRRCSAIWNCRRNSYLKIPSGCEEDANARCRGPSPHFSAHLSLQIMHSSDFRCCAEDGWSFTRMRPSLPLPQVRIGRSELATPHQLCTLLFGLQVRPSGNYVDNSRRLGRRVPIDLSSTSMKNKQGH